MSKFQNEELEQLVIGACLVEKDSFSKCLMHISERSFSDPRHHDIFAAMTQMSKDGIPIDKITLFDFLHRQDKLESTGGAHYMIEMSSMVGSTAHLEHWCEMLKSMQIGREVTALGMDIIRKSSSENDPMKLFLHMEEGINDIQSGVYKDGGNVLDGDQLGTAMFEAYTRAKDRSLADGYTGIRTPVQELTQITSGWQDTELIILAARPGMGKTAFAMTAVNECIEDGQPVGVFSLEMSAVRLAFRLISVRTGVPANKYMQGTGSDYDEEMMMQAIEFLRTNRHLLHIDDTPGLTIMQLRARARVLKMKHDIKMLVVDYLQLMQGSGKTGRNREQEISEISRGLKLIAKELKIPVIALSQLSRSVETRGGSKKPQLSDLRESGAIEQDADLVIFLYRPEYYQILEDEEGNSTVGMGELIVAKNRNGAIKNVKCHYDSTTTAWKDVNDMADGYENPSISPDMIRRKDMGWTDLEETPF